MDHGSSSSRPAPSRAQCHRVTGERREGREKENLTMKIIQLNAENVKRLKAVEIKPGDGGLVIVAGRNGQGKTSVLDSIEYALAGKRSLPEKPVRCGQDKATITVALDGQPPLTVRRTITESGGGQLTITAGDGLRAASPQTLLDKLCGSIAFDPLEFIRMEPRKQVEVLRALVGLDFSELDAQAAELFSERTEVHRQAKAVKARLDASQVFNGAPAAEIVVSDLLGELKRRQAANRANGLHRDELKSMASAIDEIDQEIVAAEHRIAELQASLATKRQLADSLRLKHAAKSQEVRQLTDADCGEIERQIADSERLNAQVRASAARAQLADEHASLCGRANVLTERLADVASDKAALLGAAQWPVPGLGFDAGGVTLNGLPLGQASSAEQLRVSVAMGLAAHPELRVLLVRDGSLLDADSLAKLAEIAAEHDAQVWVETVSIGEQCSVIIEDGHVASPSEVEVLRGEA